ncbi:MAG: folylpolyglutamate synthase/dihydrofolate synthase family protein [candidate division NC10 bacterium]|nr:folylpolyglutamate synthase/dihydrofolate synthase family protein [candidate division NC10 bacterium]
MISPSRYQETLSYLFSLQKLGIKLGLSNMEALMGEMGNPHLQYPSVLIGGTNGKGSTAAFLDSILREAGYRVGLYTSPHLLDFRERIRVQGTAISEEEIIEGVERLRRFISALMSREPSHALRLSCHPTFFEVSTALAFHYFAERKVDIAVVEVGMGGRYDATNLAPSCLSIITNVDWDHQEYLGNQLRQIALEKAGIIKEGGWVVSGAQHPEAEEVIRQIAGERGATICRLGEDVTWEAHEANWQGQWVSIRGRAASYPRLKIQLLGGHQTQNAAAAVAAAEILREQGFEMTCEDIGEGLARALWPGRMQVVSRRPLIVVDSAHNPAGARVLSQSFLHLDGYHRLYLVFGVLADKDWRSMLEVLGPLAGKIILCRPPSERTADPFSLREEFKERFPGIEVCPEVAQAISRARSLASAEDAILVAGSIFTAAEALRALEVPVP